MSDLKGKLAQKVEKTKEKDARAKEVILEAEVEVIDGSKITKLLPSDTNQSEVIVPEFAITINEAKQRTKNAVSE